EQGALAAADTAHTRTVRTVADFVRCFSTAIPAKSEDFGENRIHRASWPHGVVSRISGGRQRCCPPVPFLTYDRAENPPKLDPFERRAAVIRGPGIESIQPESGLRLTGDYNHRQMGIALQ